MRNPPSANNVQDDAAECNKILQYSIKDHAASHLLKQVWRSHLLRKSVRRLLLPFSILSPQTSAVL
jgi:hypothetical protein